jgi:peptide-methionine (S)-S-oxide reductase
MSWRLKLILLLGCLGGLGVALFALYVKSISDLPLGPTPLSWGFKSSSAHVAEIFSKEISKMEPSALETPEVPAIDKTVPDETELALFALGWFWSVDSRFGSLPGVIRTTVGYSGGTTASPTYRSIGDHSEVIRIEFDHTVISYKQLLDVFWDSHDPEYNAYSLQYRNAIFTLTEKQRNEAESSLNEMKEVSHNAFFTTVEPAGEFYAAEDYHQKYLLRKANGIMQEFQVMYPEPQLLIASTAATRINGYLGCNGKLEVLEKELTQFGLTRKMQELLVKHVSTNCGNFFGLTCPSPKSSPWIMGHGGTSSIPVILFTVYPLALFWMYQIL